jgi:aspartate/methionine/tyrosine aminotransferase
LENNAYLFQYGPTVGIYDARVTIARFLTEGYRAPVNRYLKTVGKRLATALTILIRSADLVLTSGATHGLHLILSTLLDMSAVIFVDEVTYMIALEAFSQFSSMKVVPGERLPSFRRCTNNLPPFSSADRQWCGRRSSHNRSSSSQIRIAR